MFVESFTLFCRLWSKPEYNRPTERRSSLVSGRMSVFGTARADVDENLFSEFWRDQVFVGGGRKFFFFLATFSSTAFKGFLESLTWTCRFLKRRRSLKNAADMGEINFVVVVYSRWIYVRMIRNSSKALLHFGTRGMIICWMRLTYKLTSLPHHAPSSMHKSYLVIPRTS